MAGAWKDMHWNLFQWSTLDDQNWVFGMINFEIQLLTNINWFWVKFFFSHGSVFCMLQSPRVLSFVCCYTSKGKIALTTKTTKGNNVNVTQYTNY